MQIPHKCDATKDVIVLSLFPKTCVIQSVNTDRVKSNDTMGNLSERKTELSKSETP